MRCFFNLVDGHDRVPDLEGVEVCDLGTLEAEATSAVLENLEQQPDENLKNWRMEVTDASGTVLLTIPFARVLAERDGVVRHSAPTSAPTRPI